MVVVVVVDEMLDDEDEKLELELLEVEIELELEDDELIPDVEELIPDTDVPAEPDEIMFNVDKKHCPFNNV